MRGIDFSSPRSIMAGALLLLLASAPPAAAQSPDYSQPAENLQLAKIPRTILKEPKYRTEAPGYCLLAFGLDAQTRVWLVVDGDQVFLDRNGNGDLTEAGECCTEMDCGWFKLGDVIEVDGVTTHERLRIRMLEDSQFSFALRSPHNVFRNVGSYGFVRPRLAAKPADAPIIHLNGPITLASFTRINFAFRSADEQRDSQFEWLYLAAGSRGLGPGTFAIMDGDGVPGLTKGTRRVLAEIEFPGRTADAPPILSKQSLSAEGWYYARHLFAGPVWVPPEAGGGFAKMTLTFEGLEPGQTEPGTIEALVMGDEADLPAVRAACKKTIPMLATALQHEPQVRRDVAQALGLFGTEAKAAVPALMSALGDGYFEHIQLEAGNSLLQIVPADEAVAVFVPRLQDKDLLVAENAARALALFGPDAKDATAALIQCLNRERRKDDRASLDDCTCQALARIGTASGAVIPALTEALKSQTESVRNAAAKALRDIGPEAKSAVPALIVAWQEGGSDDVRVSIAQALGQMGPAAKPAVPALIQVWSDDSSRLVQGVVSTTLGEIGPEAKLAVPTLIQQLTENESGFVRTGVAETLGRIGPPAKDAVPVLKKFASGELQYEEGGFLQILRDNATQALTLIEPEGAPRD